MGREDTFTGMAGNDGHCGGGGEIAESIVTKKKKGCGALCGFFYKTKERDRERSKGKEKYCLSIAGTGAAQRWRWLELNSKHTERALHRSLCSGCI